MNKHYVSAVTTTGLAVPALKRALEGLVPFFAEQLKTPTGP
jgi:hypothetical protein